MNMNGGEFLPSGVLSFQLMLEGGLKTFSSTYTDPPQPAGFPSLQRMPLVSWGAACVWVRMHMCVCVCMWEMKVVQATDVLAWVPVSEEDWGENQTGSLRIQ